jgi:hypothetical protein
VKRLLLLVAVLAGLAAFALPGVASAAAPCRNKIFNDWYNDGRIASSYPTACYRDALKHIPADAKIYSSLSSDIDAAMLAAINHQHGKVVPKQVGRGFKPVKHPASHVDLVSLGQARPDSSKSGGGLADTASGAPLPILVLGGIAIALAAAGAIGTGVRFARRRR